MTKLVVRVLFLTVLGASTLAAQAPLTQDVISQVPFLQRVLTGNSAQSTTATAFVPFVRTTIPVPPGLTVLLSARFAAESNCTEATPTSGWCAVQISIGGVLAEPNSGADFAFDSTNSGAEGSAWESHSMDRHRCFTNTTTVTQQVPVVVEWGIAFPDATPAIFRLDDWSLVVQESQNCFDIPVTSAASAEEPQVP